MTLTELLHYLKDCPIEPVVFDPIKQEQISIYNAALKQIGFAEIPTEFQEFLTMSDGMIIGDIEVFGCEPKTREKRFYSLPALDEFNTLLKDHPFMIAKLIIASKNYYLFIYNSTTQKYCICDRTSFEVVSEFDHLCQGLHYLCELIPHD